MAEFLIRKGDQPNANGYKDGDIVEVRPDGHGWTESELPRVVKLPGMTLEDAQQYGDDDREITIDLPNQPSNTNGNLEIKRVDGTVWAVVRKNAFPLVIKTRSGRFVDVQQIDGVFNAAGESLRIDIIDNRFAKRRYKMVGLTIVDKLT